MGKLEEHKEREGMEYFLDFSPFYTLPGGLFGGSLKERLEEFRSALKERHLSGWRGIETVRMKSKFFGSLICFLYERAKSQ